MHYFPRYSTKFALQRRTVALVYVFSLDVQCTPFKLCNKFRSLGFSNRTIFCVQLLKLPIVQLLSD
jgi:hypothetical protein